MSSYLDDLFEGVVSNLEMDLEQLKEVIARTKQSRTEDAKIAQLHAIAREARYFRGSRRDIERALQSGKTPTDEQIKGVRVFEERLFRELEHLEKMENEELAMLKQRTAEKSEEGQ